jgi:Ulp1 family protease
MYESGSWSYEQVSRWGGKVEGKNIFKKRLVFAPINETNYHWSLVGADMENRVIKISYSLHNFDVLKCCDFLFFRQCFIFVPLAELVVDTKMRC